MEQAYYRTLQARGYHEQGDFAITRALEQLDKLLAQREVIEVISHTVTVLTDDYLVVVTALVKWQDSSEAEMAAAESVGQPGESEWAWLVPHDEEVKLIGVESVEEPSEAPAQRALFWNLPQLVEG